MREKLIESFEDTLKASDSYVLSMRTRQSMMLSEVYEEGFFSRTRSVDKNGKILILPMTTFQAARMLQTKSGGECGTAVLNFANPVEPGGGVRRGAMAQEECLCRSSNLYPCLSQQKIRTGFYARHAGADQAQASDRVVYVPDVVVFKSDDRLPQILSVDDWIQVDVLTCAAPYYPALENRSDAILSELYKKRARNILECAIANRADILVLGAFGCGAFRNPPYLMAGAFCEAIKEGRYLESLSVIAFAIPEDGGQSTQNLQTFKNVFFQQRLWNEQIEGKAFGEGDKQNERELHLESHLVQKIGQNVQYGSRPAEADLEDKYDWSTSGGTIVLFPTSNHGHKENLNIKPCGRYKGKLFSILGDSISTFENCEAS